MKFWQKIILRLLYLTPFGYLLSILSLLQGEKTKGIDIDLKRYSPIRTQIKQKPTFNERLNWFINGIFLLTQGWFVLLKQIAGDIGGAFALVAFIFGAVSLVAAIFPSFPWNKKLFRV
jgi:hypothetical protein